jgi:hypothetical protein
MLKRIPEDRFSSMEDVVGAFEDIAANRPVRALGAQAGPKPARRAVVIGADVPPRIEDKTVLDPPQKHAPETVPELNGVGSTLASAEDELSADTVLAAEEALQNTVSPAELALARTVMPEEPMRAKEPTVPPTEAAPGMVEEPIPPSNPAASTTLQSADAGDAVKAVREATAKEMAKEMNQVAATLASGKPNELVIELRKATEESKEARDSKESKEPKPKSGPAGATLASKGANEAVLAVRAATEKKPVRVESVPPPKKVSTPPPAQKKSNLLWIVLTIAFLALAAFAGNYFGARSRSKE